MSFASGVDESPVKKNHYNYIDDFLLGRSLIESLLYNIITVLLDKYFGQFNGFCFCDLQGRCDSD